MQFERVHTIRDLYDGIRSGTADLNGAPHYFSSLYDDEPGDFTSSFRLCPVTAEFMELELEHWSIYRAWEAKYHTGREVLETHPGHGGINLRYDELGRELDRRIEALKPLPTLYNANFLPLPGQQSLAQGILREMEVSWTPTTRT